MVEVFKTNVNEMAEAASLTHCIHKIFPDYQATFDLEDCDKILRVQCESRNVSPASLISLLSAFGFHAEILQEDDQFTAR
ncbi:MAG TPA: hypothetical protein VFW11_24410 [Cyclobacteriaceae bacterium]|nr:hypothetical protein [Cyclobacteriaceae bacterium]